MSEMALSKDLVDTSEGWNEVLKKTLSINSYKKFLEVTSKSTPIVVKNDPKLYKENRKGYCHVNCQKAESDGIGKRVSGWYLMNEFTHEDIPIGMCRLTHHSNLILADGSLVNITSGQDEMWHIFIQDDERDFDFVNRIGFNDRMVFGDSFLVGKSVPRNKIHFAAKSEFSRDIFFEKFKIYSSMSDALANVPKNLSHNDMIRWVTLKTTCSTSAWED